jgi:hypothetical protein
MSTNMSTSKQLYVCPISKKYILLPVVCEDTVYEFYNALNAKLNFKYSRDILNTTQVYRTTNFKALCVFEDYLNLPDISMQDIHEIALYVESMILCNDNKLPPKFIDAIIKRCTFDTIKLIFAPIYTYYLYMAIDTLISHSDIEISKFTILEIQKRYKYEPETEQNLMICILLISICEFRPKLLIFSDKIGINLTTNRYGITIADHLIYTNPLYIDLCPTVLLTDSIIQRVKNKIKQYEESLELNESEHLNPKYTANDYKICLSKIYAKLGM